jgi:ribonuclease HII
VVKERNQVTEIVCGIDEAGRGPLAGPVTAAAVILPPDFPTGILADSKVLSPARREEAGRVIRDRASAWAVGWASAEEIDRLNIHHATLLAMRRAVAGLAVHPSLLLVDGLFVPDAGVPGRAVVRGDATVPEIMAASIIAKTSRDAWMAAYGKREPGYGFERHKGYPTREHRAAIARLGPCAIHRRSFRLLPPGPPAAPSTAGA